MWMKMGQNNRLLKIQMEICHDQRFEVVVFWTPLCSSSRKMICLGCLSERQERSGARICLLWVTKCDAYLLCLWALSLRLYAYKHLGTLLAVFSSTILGFSKNALTLLPHWMVSLTCCKPSAPETLVLTPVSELSPQPHLLVRILWWFTHVSLLTRSFCFQSLSPTHRHCTHSQSWHQVHQSYLQSMWAPATVRRASSPSRNLHCTCLSFLLRFSSKCWHKLPLQCWGEARGPVTLS